MLHRLLGTGTAVSFLKQGLNESSERSRVIASRVANVSTPGAQFGAVLAQVEGVEGGEIDLEREMVSLADEQIRFEAATRLLQKVYAQVRASVRER